MNNILKKNIIKDVINIIKKMLKSSAVIKKEIISNKLKIKVKQLKIKINKNIKFFFYNNK